MGLSIVRIRSVAPAFRAASATGTIPITAHGREQIAVDQAQGGGYYPFVDPSDDLGRLIADLYIGLTDTDCSVALPLKIDWLHGFGEDSASVPITPVHDFDLQISDANDVVVMSTLTADTFQTSSWGDSYQVLEWVTGSDVLRVVIFLGWTQDDVDSNTFRSWPIYLEPDNAVLDSRSVELLAPRVTQIGFGTDPDDPGSDVVISAEDLILSGGYNVRLTDQVEEAGSISRANGILIDVAPGLGLGRYPCESELYVAKINGAVADARGNLRVDASGCYRLQRAITEVSDTDDRIETATMTEATLALSNDCGPCCECQDFINVYEAIRVLTDRYRRLGVLAEAIRDQYVVNKARFENSATCRAAQSLRAAAQPINNCYVAIGAGVCNNSTNPMNNVTLQICFEYGPDSNGLEAASTISGCLVCNSAVRKGNTPPDHSYRPSESVPYTLAGDWPSFSANFDCIGPGQVGVVHFLMQFPGCTDDDVVEFVVRGLGESVAGAQPVQRSVAPALPAGVTCCDASSEASPENCAEL